jgi:D-methionine transport system substrate-binding protein
MKRIHVILISLLLVAVLALTGCSAKTDKAVEDAAKSAVTDVVESAETVKETVVEVAGDAKETAAVVVDEAKETVETAVGEAVTEVVDAGKEAAAALTFSKESPITLKIGASPVPHAELLAQIVEPLAEKGIKLEVIEFTDYVQPNTALEDGSLDANFFQHFPYLDDFNKTRKQDNSNWTTLVPLVYTHFEPMGIYKGKTADLTKLPEGAKIAVPNDPTNEARALLLLKAKAWKRRRKISLKIPRSSKSLNWKQLRLLGHWSM